MKILMLTRYGLPGASSRLRAYQYLPYLRSQGLQITVFPFFADSYQEDLYVGRSPRLGRVAAAYLLRLFHLLHAPAFDLIWVEYELFPWLPALGERLLAGLRMPYVVDYDDAIYHRYELHRKSVVRLFLGRKIDEVMKRAAVVVVGNDYLGDRARAAGARRVEFLPTVVDIDRYAVTAGGGGAGLTVGWIGSPGTVGYLSLIKPALTDLLNAGRARLVIVGARDVPFAGTGVEAHPWSEATEVDDIAGFDVGIMPLPDEPWERGKCGYKLIQYMACARPVIASPVGVNRQLVEQGVNGFLARTDHEWRSAFHELMSDPALRIRLGQAGRRKVEAQYNTRVTAPRLAAILRSARSGNRGQS